MNIGVQKIWRTKKLNNKNIKSVAESVDILWRSDVKGCLKNVQNSCFDHLRFMQVTNMKPRETQTARQLLDTANYAQVKNSYCSSIL